MYRFEQQIPVLLEFSAMSQPIAVSVPIYVLRYLDTHAERTLTPEGEVLYRLPRALGTPLGAYVSHSSPTFLA